MLGDKSVYFPHLLFPAVNDGAKSVADASARPGHRPRYYFTEPTLMTGCHAGNDKVDFAPANMSQEKESEAGRAVANRYSRHSKVRILAHFVWSTTQRMPWISTEQEPRLHAYIVGICDKLGCPVVAVGSTDDHIHLLVHLNHDITVASLMNRVKGASSHFAKSTLEIPNFEWQRGYAAFGVSARDKTMVSDYIRHQRTRHANNDVWLSAEDTDEIKAS